MKTTTKNTLTTIAVLILPLSVLLVAFFLIRKKKAAGNTESANEEDDKKAVSVTKPSSSATNTAFPLRKNASAKSDLVKQVQATVNVGINGLIGPYAPYYNGSYFNTIKEDGYYGNKTAAAIAFLTGTDGNTLTEEQWHALCIKYNDIIRWTRYYLTSTTL